MGKSFDIISHFEGCKLEAYKCPAGVWTIGYGCTDPHYAFEGNVIDMGTANNLLIADMKDAKSTIKTLVTRAMDDNQLACLLSGAFNLSWRSNKNLAGYFNRDIELYKKKLLMYCNADGKKLNGLLIRRVCERLLFEDRDWLPVAESLQRANTMERTEEAILELF